MKFTDFLTALQHVALGSPHETGRVLRALIARDVGTATASAGAATLSALQGKVTTEALTTAQNGLYTLTLTNDQIAAKDIVMVSVANGTNTQGTLAVRRVQPADGSVVIVIANAHASAQALNGTVVISFVVTKAA